jgi:hypothetical protein
MVLDTSYSMSLSDIVVRLLTHSSGSAATILAGAEVIEHANQHSDNTAVAAYAGTAVALGLMNTHIVPKVSAWLRAPSQSEEQPVSRSRREFLANTGAALAVGALSVIGIEQGLRRIADALPQTSVGHQYVTCGSVDEKEQSIVAQTSAHPYIDQLVEEEKQKILSNPYLTKKMLNVFSEVSKYKDLIMEHSQVHHYDHHVAYANIAVESEGKITAKSTAGARGLTQLMPGTARMQGLRVDGVVDERLDPALCIEAGIRYLASRPGSDYAYQLACYNSGLTRVKRQETRKNTQTTDELYPHLPRETRNHIVRVLARKEILDSIARGELDLSYENRPLWSRTHTPRVVSARESMSTISREYNVPLRTVRNANPQQIDPNKLIVGQHIYVPEQ